MRACFVLLFLAAITWGPTAPGGAEPSELKVGDKAPDFTLRGSDGKEYALKDLVGKRAVVIAWFPKAFTGG